MKILVTGGTGFIGQRLGQELVRRGHQLIVITRSAEKARMQLTYPADILEWDLLKSELPSMKWPEVDAVVHLMGENVGEGRWTASRKDKIVNSRILATENLLKNRPLSLKAVISASAIGVYPDKAELASDINNKLLDSPTEPWKESAIDSSSAAETSSLISGFLATVCWRWEKTIYQNLRPKMGNAPSPREVIFRLGVVLAANGGALEKMLPLFKNRLGSPLGSGKQMMSWVHREDVVSAFCTALESDKFQGIYNLVAPQPITNRQFTEVLCAQLQVMMGPSVPKPVLKLALGEMSEMVLASQYISSEKLLATGFQFQYPEIQETLKDCLRFESLEEDVFYAEQFIDLPIEEIFNFFGEAKNLESITPTSLNFSIEKMSTPHIEQGTEIDYRLKIHGVPVRWKTRIQEWKPPHYFVDEQLKGPYSQWIHLHEFVPLGTGTLMRDRVRYKMPMGIFGKLAAGRWVKADIQQIFNYRRQRVPELLLKKNR